MAAVAEEPPEVAAGKPDPEAGTPPQPPAAAPPAASPAALDRQTLVAVLQFLRRSNLRESEEILRREARLLGDDLGAAALSPTGAGLLGTAGGEGDVGGSEALLNRVTAAAAISIGGSVATVASASPGVAAAATVPPGKGEARGGDAGGVAPGCRGPLGIIWGALGSCSLRGFSLF